MAPGLFKPLKRQKRKRRAAACACNPALGQWKQGTLQLKVMGSASKMGGWSHGKRAQWSRACTVLAEDLIAVTLEARILWDWNYRWL